MNLIAVISGGRANGLSAVVTAENHKDVLKEFGIESIIAPPFYWGICQSTQGFIGSFSIRKETAKSLLNDIVESLNEFGFDEIYGINAHEDIEQNAFIIETFKELAVNRNIKVRYLFREEIMCHYGITGSELFICPVEKLKKSFSSTEISDVHGGDIETAIINKFYPDFVNTSIAHDLPPIQLPNDRAMEWLLGGKTDTLSKKGYFGDTANYYSVDAVGYIDDLAHRIVKSIISKRELDA